ncbi:MAG: membrane protein insertion efficiency factor YidD [Candidatus Omnitrophica bacterium]|nr:membrane protein insertion efficiency factor YidD [Candidatus Omnitrophota bacterium]
MKKVLIGTLNFYRKVLSNNKLQTCRFVPTCSGYAVEALEKYTLPRAFVKIAWRLLRCHPFCPGGYDPV